MIPATNLAIVVIPELIKTMVKVNVVQLENDLSIMEQTRISTMKKNDKEKK